MNKLQEEAAQWHRQKYPFAGIKDILNKFFEEAGEVAAAINKNKGDNLYEEIGDAAFCLMVLTDRMNWDFDSLLETRVKEVTTR